MKKLLSLALILMVSATSIFAQTGNAAKGNYKGSGGTPHEVVKGKNVTISYGRPYKKGRDIFGGLEAYGKVWRTGADEATEITFDKDVLFGDKKVAAGTYTLFTIPGKDKWTVILNKELKQWGAYKYNDKNDVARVTAPVQVRESVVEQFTIVINNDQLILLWDLTSVAIPMKF